VTVTKLTNALEIQAAQKAFEERVTPKVYAAHFSAIGAAFKVSSLIGKKHYIYVKCEMDGKVVGMAYGWPEERGSTFYIQDIISAPGSHSGSAMVAWFCDKANVGMETMRRVALTAANEKLQTDYAKPHYGLTLEKDGKGRMSKAVI